MSVDRCYACKQPMVDEAYFSWVGAPFGTRKQVDLCLYCGHVIKPQQTEAGIAVIGTSGGDVYHISEMIEDGFTDKTRLRRSIRSVGEYLGLEPKKIQARLTSRSNNEHKVLLPP